uniref:Uncharacterized protein n=1 Tax=Romanomermis culicivorax TaxID=13658 RepID=A0A915I5I7_ROMCU
RDTQTFLPSQYKVYTTSKPLSIQFDEIASQAKQKPAGFNPVMQIQKRNAQPSLSTQSDKIGQLQQKINPMVIGMMLMAIICWITSFRNG